MEAKAKKEAGVLLAIAKGRARPQQPQQTDDKAGHKIVNQAGPRIESMVWHERRCWESAGALASRRV